MWLNGVLIYPKITPQDGHMVMYWLGWLSEICTVCKNRMSQDDRYELMNHTLRLTIPILKV
jgi:hypothetical protein